MASYYVCVFTFSFLWAEFQSWIPNAGSCFSLNADPPGRISARPAAVVHLSEQQEEAAAAVGEPGPQTGSQRQSPCLCKSDREKKFRGFN